MLPNSIFYCKTIFDFLTPEMQKCENWIFSYFGPGPGGQGPKAGRPWPGPGPSRATAGLEGGPRAGPSLGRRGGTPLFGKLFPYSGSKVTITRKLRTGAQNEGNAPTKDAMHSPSAELRIPTLVGAKDPESASVWLKETKFGAQETGFLPGKQGVKC